MTTEYTHHLDEQCPRCSRRGLVRAGLGATAALAAAGTLVPGHALAGGPMVSGPLDLYRGQPLPLPIPYINPGNGQHVFGPVPWAEPSTIDNFRGQVGVANIAATGHDGTGRALAIGGPSTELRFQRGEYVTMDGVHHTGAFVHI